MYYKLRLTGVPTIKYAHYFTKKNYLIQCHTPINAFELAYIINGSLYVQKDEQTQFLVPPGNFLILSTKLGMQWKSEKDELHIHHTIQLECDHDITFVEDDSHLHQDTEDCLILPVCIECTEAYKPIAQALVRLIKEYHDADQSQQHFYALKAIRLFTDVSELFLKQTEPSAMGDSIPSTLTHKIKRYIAENIHRPITLSDIASTVGKTPNYINSVFKTANHITINQYINKEKIMLIIHLMNDQHASFKTACEQAGIFDISYGYRLFKKITGTTPQLYLKTSFIRK